MLNKKALVMMLTLILINVLTVVVYTQQITVPRSPDTYYVGLPPLQFQSIQQAINYPEVGDGDIIEVEEEGGPYYEHLIVNKSLTIRQRGQQYTPVIDGSGFGTVVNITAPNVVLSHLIIRNGTIGVHISETSANNTINHVEISSNDERGLYVDRSCNNTLRNAILLDNKWNFGVSGSPTYLEDFVQDIDYSNTVNGKPICYWVNQHDKTVPEDAGYVAVVNSDNIVIENIAPENNAQDVLVVNSTRIIVRNLEFTYPYVDCEVPVQFIATDDSTIYNVTIWQGLIGSFSSVELHSSNYNNITGNTLGTRFGILPAMAAIGLRNSSNNRIIDNIITHTTNVGYPLGIVLEYESNGNMIIGNTISTHTTSGVYLPIALASSNETTIYHNNFLDDNNQLLSLYSYDTRLENGREGNYWSDYGGTDSDGDGIGDTPYIAYESSVDYYPLMEHWSARKTFIPKKEEYVSTNQTIRLSTFSNSTLASLSFNRNLKKLSLRATSGYSGFLNITIPRDWLDSPFEVRVDGEQTGYNYAVNSIYSCLYITYNSGGHTIEIVGTELGTILGDIDGDGDVDIFDVVKMASNYGTTAPDEYDLVPKP
jgi:nitrous oxidase accessory protein NosD